MPAEVIPLYVASFANLMLGLMVFARSYRKIYSWFFMIAVIGVVTWSIGDALILTTKSPEFLTFVSQLFYIGPMAIPVFMWFFSLSFPERKVNRPAILFGMVVFVLAGLAIYIWPHGLIKSISITDGGLNVPHINGPGFFVYAAYFSLMFTLSYMTLIRLYMSQRSALLRTQVLYVLVGLLLGSVPALVTNLVLPLAGNSRLIWMGPIFSSIFVAAVTISIVRHRLFDIRLFIARSLGYLSSVFVIAVVFGVLTISVINKFILNDTHISLLQQSIYSVMAIAIAIIYQPLKRFFDRITNKLFYRDSYDTQAFIDDLNRVLVANVDVELLLSDATKVIDANLKSDFSAVTLRETSYISRRFIGTKDVSFNANELEVLKNTTTQSHHRVIVTDDIAESNHELHQVLIKHNIAVIARLVTTLKYDTEGIGYLVIGAKKSGNAYSKQDTNIIRIVANELVIAIQNALRFEEIENFSVTLQEKVDDATKRLKKANEKLKTLDETKDEFISMASHQLRTPLTSVKGYLSMVLEGDAGELNDMQRKLLGQSFTSSQKMVYLIADLLNLSRLRTGKFVIDAAPANLADVITGEVEQLQEAAKTRNLELTYVRPETFPTLMMDETKIRQVLMNFIDNAIYYTPSGGHITIGLKETKESIEFTVKDDGIGVPIGEQHHLFNKFYRAGNARKARPDGTGLGLFMAKKVIIASGGALIFKSTVNKGSTFGFTFSKKKLAVSETIKPKQADVIAKSKN